MKKFNPLTLTPLVSLAAAGAIGFSFAPAQAATVTLADLFGGQTLLVGDKLFSNWILFADPGLIDYSQVTVTGLNDDPLNPGLLYDFGDQLSGSGVNISTIGTAFAFIVGVVNAPYLIEDTSLELKDYEVTGDGSLALVAGPFDLLGGGLLSAPVIVGANIDFDGNGLTTIPYADVKFTPQEAIGVTNTASAQTDDLGGTFALKTFEQRFSQTPIPEGSPVLSLLVGAGALGAGSAFSSVLKSRRKNNN